MQRRFEEPFRRVFRGVPLEGGFLTEKGRFGLKNRHFFLVVLFIFFLFLFISFNFHVFCLYLES